MRLSNGLLAGLAGLVAVAMVGCGGAGSLPPPYSGARLPSASSSLTAPGRTESTVKQAGPTEPQTTGGARTAASKFYRLYSAGQFAASWNLLSPAAQEAIPRAIWISVHNGCRAGAGTGRLIRSVLVFGNAAIVTESFAGADSRLGKAEDVFNYVGGHWGYTPNDLSIYHHGGVAADIAAAKKLGFCTGRKQAPL